jgi:hypothetical protein
MRTFAFQSAPLVASSIWEQQGSAIIGDADYDYLGSSSVTLSADAKTLLVGAPDSYANTKRGGYVKVYHMTNDGRNRIQLGQTIYRNATGDLFVYSADISAGGNIIVVGTPGNYEHKGYIQVFSLYSNNEAGMTDTWKEVGQDITQGIIVALGDDFGVSVSISNNGKTIAVVAPDAIGNNGVALDYVRIYQLEDNGTSWEQIGKDIDGEGAFDYSGILVSLLANG